MPGAGFHLPKLRSEKDFLNKLTNPVLIKPVYWPVIFLLLPMVLAFLVSTMFGQSLEQLRFTREFSIVESRPLVSLLIPFLAPALEEPGWSGYEIDSLRSRFNLFTISAISGWPGRCGICLYSSINDYYHYNILNENIIYALNF